MVNKLSVLGYFQILCVETAEQGLTFCKVLISHPQLTPENSA